VAIIHKNKPDAASKSEKVVHPWHGVIDQQVMVKIQPFVFFRIFERALART